VASEDTAERRRWRLPSPRRRWQRVLAVGLAAIVLLAALFYGGGGWYFSGVIEQDALVVSPTAPEYPIEVTAVGEDTITLTQVAPFTNDDDLLTEAQWGEDLWVGVGTADVSGLAGPATERTETVVTRRYVPPAEGALAVGDRVRLDVRAFWPNPERGLGHPYSEVAYEDELGSFPAWRIPGDDGDTWALYVHGKGADRVEPLRIAAALDELGLTGMSITYRNDAGAPHVSGDIARYGQTEWEDLDAAAAWAHERGAERFVLVGTSMGASIVLGFLERSPLADRVAAVVLDSPATDIGGIIRDGARNTTLIPGVVDVGPGLTWTAMTIASRRFDISWDATDYNARAGEFDVPMLIWAGEHDETVPIATIRGFADGARPGLVRLEVAASEEVDHLMTWNLDPERYESVTRAFVERHLEDGAADAG
jgi:pimeloyl-ACP methyl ester carboxylesterase